MLYPREYAGSQLGYFHAVSDFKSFQRRVSARLDDVISGIQKHFQLGINEKPNIGFLPSLRFSR